MTDAKYDGKGSFFTEPLQNKKTVALDTERSKKKQEEAREKEYFEKISRFAQYLNTVSKTYANERGLDPEEVAGGFYLESCNIRHFYPSYQGGTPHYDSLVKRVWDWFKSQLQKSE